MNHKVRANRKRKKKLGVMIDSRQLEKTMRDNNLMMTLSFVAKMTGLPRELVFRIYKLGKEMGLIERSQ
jgi:hypothetical protein